MNPGQPTLLGQKLGHIRIIGRLGEGGMGEVYLGFDEKLKRKVAVKAISSQFRLNEVAKARFLREARILSQLKHPSVCVVHDFIERDDADLLVLELVEGRNLRATLERGMTPQQKMSVARQLLEVLVAVHAEGVIHRDLKPENVMVTGDGGIKVLDFGLARSVDEEAEVVTAKIKVGTPRAPRDMDSEQTIAPSYHRRSAYVMTQLGSVVGTAGYMSPEQARGEPATAASDMYSLGLILQEMFTDEPPFEQDLDAQELLGRAARAETLPVTGLAADLQALIDRLKSPAPGVRPSSVDALAALNRIVDRPRRRRRRLVVGAVWATLVLLSLGLAVQTFRALHQADLARQEASLARNVSAFLVGLFEVSDPSESRGRTVTARELLDRGSERISLDLADEPEARARMMLTMGTVYRLLGLYGQAQPMLENALEQQRRLFGDEHLEVTRGLHELADLYDDQGRYDEAIGLLQRVLEIRQREQGLDHPDLAPPLSSLATTYQSMGRYDEAHAYLERSRTILEEAPGDHRSKLATTFDNLANLHVLQGRYDAAQPLYEQALASHRSFHGDDHPSVAIALFNLAMLYRLQGRYAEAMPMLEEALEIRTTALGPDHPAVARSLCELANNHLLLERFADAIPLYERALAIQERSLGPSHPGFGLTLNSLGVALREVGRLGEAETVLQRALEIWIASLGPDHPYIPSALHGLGEIYHAQGRYDEAEARFSEALGISERVMGPNHPAVAYPLDGLAKVASAQNRSNEAIDLLERALAIREATLADDHPEAVATLEALRDALLASGRTDDAALVSSRLTERENGTEASGLAPSG